MTVQWGSLAAATRPPSLSSSAGEQALGMHERERFLAEISEHCDLGERLATVLPSAKSRQIYVNAVSGVLQRAGMLNEYQRLMPETHPRCGCIRWGS